MRLQQDELLTVFSELWRGKSISRVFLNVMVARHVSLQGTVVDLGGGRSPSYWRFIHPTSRTYLICVDLNPIAHPEVLASLETPLPFADAQADVVLLFNVLEHIFNHRRLLQEIRRVLRRDGQLYVWVPFLVAVHGDPFDYFRYTGRALRRLLTDSGFDSVQIFAAGGLFFAIVNLLEPVWRWRLMRVLGGGLALSLEAMLPGTYRRQADERWPVGYLLLAS